MRKKYYRDDDDGSWKFVTVNDDEERELTEQFIREYAVLIKKIEQALSKCDQKYVSDIFNKIASPVDAKFEEILTNRRDEAKYGKEKQKKLPSIQE
ncbi:MAG: hypothetical protein PHW96_03610 [Candidatus Nanoarchaeia archaeon]|nr:hypothetical protein [Candidatus Nanoarchaeia archaeon]